MYSKKILLLYLLIFNLFFIFQISSFAQTNTIKGKVVDADNQPVFAANVYSSSFPNKGTTTDFDGFFYFLLLLILILYWFLILVIKRIKYT